MAIIIDDVVRAIVDSQLNNVLYQNNRQLEEIF